jgi:hypothetical protein
MSSHTVSSAPTPAASTASQAGKASKATGESRVAKLFGLSGDTWMRHSNPWSVWTRFAFLPMFAVAVWSRDWIGWWSLVPIVLSLVFMMINPLLFKPPKSTRNWASKAVFGERVWADRNKVEIPARYRVTRSWTVAYTAQFAGMVAFAYGLVRLDLAMTLTGLVLVQTAKGWFLDRMVLMYDDMKERNAEYAKWEY